ncbi:hypothetical protein [Viridibacterium curvum]|uniref:Uncharacterized protein n=1 Tax=Viridibacterium curvum TaxID=1101404 RepID=A0ABP9QWQ2_9RHOO
MGLQDKAGLLLAAVESGADVPGGVFLAKALQQAKLDYSEASLQRIDALLSQVRAKLKPVKEGFLDDAARENFTLTLAFYLGSYVARELQDALTWHSLEEAAQQLPEGSLPNDEFVTHVLGLVPGSWLLPLVVLEDGLFSGTGEYSAAGWVKRTVERMLTEAQAVTLEWDIGNLDRFLRGEKLRGGVAFEEELRAIRLDFSIESLIQIDELLRTIRAREALVYPEYIRAARTANLSRLLAVYMTRTAAVRAQCSLKWIEYAQAKEMGMDFELQFETTFLAAMGDQTLFPLLAVHELLFSEKPTLSCTLFAKKVLELKLPQFVTLRRGMPVPDKKGTGLFGKLKAAPTMEWKKEVEQAAFVMGYGAYMALGGSEVPPTVLLPSAEGKGTLLDLSFMGDGEAISRRAEELMQHNPENVPYQVHLYEGYSNLPHGRMDTLLVHLKCYQRPTLSLLIGVPYTLASAGFSLRAPIILQSTADPSLNAEIAAVFFEGLDNHKSINWREHEVVA